MGNTLGPLFTRLARSKFRNRFRFGRSEQHYVQSRPAAELRSHAERFVAERLAPAKPPNDGRQTPMRGHPVFIAQHATGTCCRTCLAKWHHLPAGRELAPGEQAYIVDVLMEWIARQPIDPAPVVPTLFDPLPAPSETDPQ